MNPYLKAKRDQYEQLRSGIEGLQNLATTEKRDLKPEELRSIKEQGEQAQELYTQIESLTAIETRNQKVAQLAATVTGSDGAGDQSTGEDGQDDAGGAGGGQKDRSAGEDGQGAGGHQKLTGAAATRDRDPGHYRSEKAGGKHSFFADLHRSKALDDDAAKKRLGEHTRALATGVAGLGLVAPKWMVEEFEAIAHQGRRVANAVRQVDLGDDVRPITLPRQTTGAAVAEQVAENDPVLDDDAFGTAVVTVTPKVTAGVQIVSRQMLDMGSPAVDQLIYTDLMADYNDKVERRVVAAMLASAGPAVVTLATNAAFATDLGESLIDAALAVHSDRHRSANIAVMNVARWGRYKKLKDTTNRPLVPSGNGGPQNVIGVGTVMVDGQLHDLNMLATNGMAATFPEAILVANAGDTMLFESAVMRFRYEEPLGPESIKLGVWGYVATHVKYAGASVKRITVTAAA